jgi:hypothetical protein
MVASYQVLQSLRYVCGTRLRASGELCVVLRGSSNTLNVCYPARSGVLGVESDAMNALKRRTFGEDVDERVSRRLL